MTLRAATLTLALLLVPTIASAHVALTDPVPRSGDNGLTVGPCGGIPAGVPTPFTAGETITVSWAVGQGHGGSLTIDFAAADDTGFRTYVLAADVSDAEGMPTSIDVQLPDIDCEACTLRLTQNNPDEDEYYSCADIALSGASAGSTGGVDGTAGEEGSSDAGSAEGTAGEGESTGAPDPSTTTGDSASDATVTASASATDPTATASASDSASAGTGDSSSSGAGGDDDDSGCSCSTERGSGGLVGLLVVGLGLVVRRRR